MWQVSPYNLVASPAGNLREAKLNWNIVVAIYDVYFSKVSRILCRFGGLAHFIKDLRNKSSKPVNLQLSEFLLHSRSPKGAFVHFFIFFVLSTKELADLLCCLPANLQAKSLEIARFSVFF